jgi:D-alanyl-D-alanine endopeptidase (penicillin-binding protein 7)
MIKEKFMKKQNFLVVLFFLGLASFTPKAYAADISAKAYIVTDTSNNSIIVAENQNVSRAPASLTKLVTLMVVMDTKPNFEKETAITKADQIAGECGKGGGCLKTKVGTKYLLKDLFYAAMLPSANNAANALSRSTGLNPSKFVARMNAKVKALGAKSSKFYEPTGMSEKNVVTAADYSKIVTAAFKYPFLKEVAQTASYDIVALNDPAYNLTVKNNNNLLGSEEVNIIGAKNGYIGSVSGYNYGALIKTKTGKEFSVVLLGEPHMYTAYDDTKFLVKLVESLQEVALK